jgi:hypothetical protein
VLTRQLEAVRSAENQYRCAAQGVQGDIRQCLFQANEADFGGAIFRGSTNGNILGSVFLDNRAKSIGGAIYDSHAQVCPPLIRQMKEATGISVSTVPPLPP